MNQPITDIVPQAGTCDACGVALDDEDGYVVFDETGGHRYCDNCPDDEEGEQ